MRDYLVTPKRINAMSPDTFAETIFVIGDPQENDTHVLFPHKRKGLLDRAVKGALLLEALENNLVLPNFSNDTLQYFLLADIRPPKGLTSRIPHQPTKWRWEKEAMSHIDVAAIQNRMHPLISTRDLIHWGHHWHEIQRLHARRSKHHARDFVPIRHLSKYPIYAFPNQQKANADLFTFLSPHASALSRYLLERITGVRENDTQTLENRMDVFRKQLNEQDDRLEIERVTREELLLARKYVDEILRIYEEKGYEGLLLSTYNKRVGARYKIQTLPKDFK